MRILEIIRVVSAGKLKSYVGFLCRRCLGKAEIEPNVKLECILKFCYFSLFGKKTIFFGEQEYLFDLVNKIISIQEE